MLQADVRDRGGVPAGGVGAERVPHQVRERLLQRGGAALRHAAQGRLRRRRRLRLPHHALRHAPLRLLLQGPRRATAHHQRRWHRHDPHLIPAAMVVSVRVVCCRISVG
uniref:Uncharacterized protein n=1 Tax=Aegilops tauschii subsp. strangulata TaxID=200361 RepID=A0A453DG61_AEGTS